MPTPAISKTYAYRLNQRILASTVVNENKDTILALFASLKGTGLVTYQAGGGGPAYSGTVFNVRSANNGAGTFGNNDNVERISARADIVHAASGSNHSWWHCQFGSSGIHLLFDFNTSVADASTMAVYASVNGFGAANGGANGTATARPTASDEVALQNSLTTAAVWAKTTSEDRLLGVYFSNDGEVIRAFVRSGVSATYVWSLEVEKGKAPLDPGWVKPWFGRQNFNGGVGAVFGATVLSSSSTTAYYGFKNGGGRFTSALLGLGYNSGGLATIVNPLVEGYTSARLESPQFLHCATAGADVGYRCERFDCWWIPNGLNDGDVYPVSPSADRTHAVFHDVLYPNDGSAPVLT